MKNLYKDLEMQVLFFEAEDIVTLSQNGKDDTAEDIFEN